MANLLSIARPYALAAFEYARENQQLLEWQAFLNAASLVLKDQSIALLIKKPKLDSSILADLFHSVLASLLDDKRKNFLSLIIQNKRLSAFPDIADVFNNLYLELKEISKVRVVTAIEVQEDYKVKLAAALSKRVKHNVTLSCEIDPNIIAGAVFHIGDKVIDGSVRGKLTRMYQSLSS